MIRILIIGSVRSLSSLFHIDQTIPCQELTHEIELKKYESMFTMMYYREHVSKCRFLGFPQLFLHDWDFYLLVPPKCNWTITYVKYT